MEAKKDKLRGESRLGGPARTAAARRAAEDAAVAAAERTKRWTRITPRHPPRADDAPRRRRGTSKGETYHPETVLLATNTPMETPPGRADENDADANVHLSTTPSRTPPPSAPRAVDGVPSPTRAKIASSSMTGRFERARVRPRAEEERDEVRTSTASVCRAVPGSGDGISGGREGIRDVDSSHPLDYTDEFDEDFDEEELELP